MIVGGCKAEWTLPERYERGLVIVLPGIEGVSGLNLRLCDALDQGGVDYAIELRSWAGIFGPLGNQRDEVRNRRIAANISERIVEYQDEHPDKPVIVIGHSGGTAIAVWTAEAMPEDRSVDGVILLSSSLSAKYDLLPALEKSGRGIAHFYSRDDGVLLGVGTRTAGTMDGTHSRAAGRHGFDVPDSMSLWAYERLYQIVWTPELRKLGVRGGHTGFTTQRFAETVLAPMVMNGPWGLQAIDQLIVDGIEAAEPTTQPETQPADESDQDTETDSDDAADS